MKKNSIKSMIPNITTLIGLCFGITAIRFALSNQFELSVICIVMASVCDVLDGRFSRFFKSESRLGAELDSLADFLNFGIAPGLLIYISILQDSGITAWIAILTFIVLSCLRLARFNATKSDIQGQCFIGLATPAAAAVLASTIIAFENLFGSRVNPGFIVAIVYILAFLMVSNIKYPAFKKFEFRKRVSFTRFLLVVLVLYILATIPKIALFVISFGYTILGPIKEWKSQKEKFNTSLDTVKHAENN